MGERRRFAVSVCVAAIAMTYVAITPSLFPAYRPDFDQLWEAGRAWRSGANPYLEVLRIHQRLGHSFGLVYPFPAVMAATPLSFLPLEYARGAFVGLAAGCLSYLLLGRAWWLFPVLLSGAMRSSVSLGQVAPFVACAVLVPWFGWAAAFKPNVGMAAWLAQPSRKTAQQFLLPAVTLALLSLILWPRWPVEWIAALRTADHFRPFILHPLGWPLALAALRWRDPAARYLLALALVPSTPAIHDALPLLVLLPTSLRSALIFALLSHVADLWGYWLAVGSIGMAEASSAHATALLIALYLPALGWLLVGQRTMIPAGA